ncbi:hypothetical protein Barb7_01016 [Bacteroidales bacterium Barb7]|nr:hypothetical protein Barb7_01016 [Bacteroidales bacterium Barb7]
MKKPSPLILCSAVFIALSLTILCCADKRTKEIDYADTFPFNPPEYVCYRTPFPIVIDGILSPDEWDAVPWTSDFVDIEGDDRPLPSLQTRAKMVHDEQGMYFAACMEEPHIWATVTEHDAVIYCDNDFELFLNPSNDTHNYLEYEVNAFGTVWDLYLTKPYRDGGIALNNWEFAGMQSAVHIDGTLNNPADTDRAWTVEIFIPWSSIYQVAPQGKPAEGEQIRINFSRVEWTTEIQNNSYQKIPIQSEDKIREYNRVWAPTGEINIHKPEYWGRVQFTSAIAGTAQVPFVRHPDEATKQILRALYYRQRQYHQAFGTYASDPADLKAEDLCPPSLLRNLAITAIPSAYEISLAGWHIRQDGLIWQL